MSLPEPTESPSATSEKSPARRSKMLIKPGIQLRLGGIFAGLTMLCLLIQFLLFTSLLTNAASSMPVGGDFLLDLVPGLLYRSLAFSALIALPLTMLAGVYATFGITGPIYRFESYLREVIKGKQLGPCKIRKGDSLDELCGLINDATEPLRRRQVDATPAGTKETEAA
jgi:hypothetical protein